MRQCGHQRHHPNGWAGPLGPSGGAPWALHLQSSNQGAVACHAHGGEKEDTGVHVHGGDWAHDLAHDLPKGPAEVQQRVHGPEGQGEDELEVCESQAHHKAVNGGVVVSTATGVKQEECQEVTHEPQNTYNQINQGNDNSYLSHTHTHIHVLCLKGVFSKHNWKQKSETFPTW